MRDTGEPVEAAQDAGDGRTVCPDCGRPVRYLTQHRRKVHGVTPRPRTRKDRQPKPPGTARPAAGATRRKLPSLYDELVVTYSLVAQMWAMRDPVCGEVALAQVPQIALAWDTWAASSASVHRIITAMLASGGFVTVALAHAPLVMVVAQHHGPRRDEYFPPPPVVDAATREPNGGAGPPVGSAYAAAPGSADRAR